MLLFDDIGNISCLAHFCPNLEKLVLSIPARDYSGNRPWKSYANSESGKNLVMYDVYICYDDVVDGIEIPGIHFSITIMTNANNN